MKEKEKEILPFKKSLTRKNKFNCRKSMIKSVKKNNNNINLDSSHTSHSLDNTKITFFKYNNNFINEILALEKKEKYYWFAAYDKLIKKKNILKIFYFYNLSTKNSIALGNKNLYDELNNIKEKILEIKNYEIFFVKNMNNKPFIRKSEGNKIYVKLYLLTLKQINMIYSYINKIGYDDYFTSFNDIIQKNINININNNITYPMINCLGSYMNIYIYSFSRKINNINELDLIPNSKKIAKLIKILLINFTEYSKEYFIDYIFSYYNMPSINLNETMNKILKDKKNEINHLLISNKKSLYKINSSIENVTNRGIGYISNEFSISPYTNSLNNNTSNNTKNNLLNNINTNNIGSISYNTSYFDFTSDYLISIKQNEENLSKLLKSINNNNNITNLTKNKNLNDIFSKNNSISTFSVDKENKTMKLSFNKNMLLNNNNSNKNNSNKTKNIFIKKEIINDIDKYKIPMRVSTKIGNNKRIKNKLFLENSNSLNYHNNTEIINKENINSYNINKNRKKISSGKRNKSYIKGENIFQSSYIKKQKNNSSYMFILDKNGTKGFDPKEIRKTQIFRLSNNQIIINK